MSGLVSDVLESSEIAAILVYEYLTLEDAYKNLQILFQARKIDQDRLDVLKIKNLLDFVNLNKKVVKKVASKTPKSEKNQIYEDEESEDEIETMVEKFEHTRNMDKEPIDFFNLPGKLAGTLLNVKSQFFCPVTSSLWCKFHYAPAVFQPQGLFV